MVGGQPLMGDEKLSNLISNLFVTFGLCKSSQSQVGQVLTNFTSLMQLEQAFFKRSISVSFQLRTHTRRPSNFEFEDRTSNSKFEL